MHNYSSNSDTDEYSEVLLIIYKHLTHFCCLVWKLKNIKSSLHFCCLVWYRWVLWGIIHHSHSTLLQHSLFYNQTPLHRVSGPCVFSQGASERVDHDTAPPLFVFSNRLLSGVMQPWRGCCSSNVRISTPWTRTTRRPFTWWVVRASSL